MFDLLLIAADAYPADTGALAEAVTDAKPPDPARIFIGLRIALNLGFFTIVAGMILCLWRIWRGPSLADRVLASDTFGLHVVALVVLLTIYLGDLTFFDAALGVSVIGFVATVGFAQYIGAGGNEGNPLNPKATPPTDHAENAELAG